MLFNSIEFVVFFVILFALYYFVFKEKTKPQNILLLVASYFFYAWADWRILPLLIISTLVFYGLGIAIFNAVGSRRATTLSTFGVVFGIAVLGYFKYTNFFISSFKDLFDNIGLQTNLHTFNIILPIGISFYTFRLLSYVIDINRGKYEPTRDIVAFSTYVAFFPCILSGPIDRPNTLIPQLQNKRTFDYALAVDGCRQILWGLFKKIVIADNCVVLTNEIFNNSTNYSGSSLVLGAIFYTFQLYADFSGYTDVALGVGKLLGFRLTPNFNYPLFAQNIADYWRRWHISLTSWLTDYVFMPLNVKWRDWGKWGMILSIMTTFLLIGSWHGANWTFVVFGLYQGLLYIPLILSGTMFKKTTIVTYKWGFPKLKTLGNMLLTFALVAFGLILFRIESAAQAVNYISEIFSSSLFTRPTVHVPNGEITLLCIAIFMVMEWLGRENQFAIEKMGATWKKPWRIVLYYAIAIATFLFSAPSAQEFIYFKF
ncbi:O-acyltransferase [Bacteroidia bacterium]|nr:O-acyltransferase [Bacteroidia bacterium]